MRKRNAITRRENKAFIRALKEAPCCDCGVQYAPHVMQYDHRDPMAKLKSISDCAGETRQFILDEIAKCDLVCANCHSERTHRQHQAGMLRRHRLAALEDTMKNVLGLLRAWVVAGWLMISEPTELEETFGPGQEVFA